MDSYNIYCEKYPIREMVINDKIFKYRHYENNESDITLVLLVGGLGLSDLVYKHFIKFSENFSVITFDYCKGYNTADEITDAINILLTKLNIKTWFVGQSLGGFVAQLMAVKYPEVTEGLVLSNTGCMSSELSEEAYSSLMDMINNTEKSKKILKLVPFSLFKKLISIKVMNLYGKNLNIEDRRTLKSVCNIMKENLTKEYELHMLNLLIDFKNHFGMTKKQLIYLKDRTLLLLSEDDETFNKDVKQSLIELMTEPVVNTTLTGGHISLMVNSDDYVNNVTEYIKKRK